MNRPRFRTDLVTTPIEEDGKRFVDVTDPDSGRTFRFYEVEYAVAAAMDGNRDVNGLIAWARAELGLEPSAAEVETVISTLGDLGYLGDSDDDASDAATTAPRDPLDVSDLSLGAPGKSPIRADQRKRSEASNIDLGSAGRSPMAGGRRDSSAPNVELGAAGGTGDDNEPLTGAPPAPPPMDMPEAPPAFGIGAVDPKKTLMGTGALSLDPAAGAAAAAPAAPELPNVPAGTDLSVDLGQHINIGTDDVKEAVRASKVMAVPEIPDFASEAPTGPAPGSTPLELPGRPARPPSAQPRPPVGAAPDLPPPPTSAARGGPSVVTILLFVLLLAALGGAAYYFFIHTADDKAENQKRPANKAVATETPDPGKKKSKPVGMVTKGQKQTTEIKSPRAGKVSWLIAAEAVVSKDDVLAKFDGYQTHESAIEKHEASKARYQDKLDKAQDSGNKASMKRYDGEVKRKQGDIDAAQAKLDEFLVRAPSDGVVSLTVENGAQIAEDDLLVKITRETWPTATFTVGEEAKYEKDAKLEVAVRSDPSKTAVCQVVSFEGNQLLVKCPPESGLDENAALVLR